MHLHRRNRNRSGFSLAETVISAAIALTGIGAAMTLNGAHLKLVQSSRQSNAATLALQERVEQMRILSWTKLTSAAKLQETLLSTDMKSVAPLHGPRETITVSRYPKASAGEKLILERNANGRISVLSAGDGFPNQQLA